MKKMKHKLDLRTEGSEIYLVCTDPEHDWRAHITEPNQVSSNTIRHGRDVAKEMPPGIYEVAGYGGATFIGWLRPDRTWKGLDKEDSFNTPSTDYLSLIGLYDGPEK